MKFIAFIFLLIFLIVPNFYAQSISLVVKGDTTDLKNYAGSGMVILEKYGKGNNNGGGLFHKIDSTYAEGKHAFDHPATGYQWARINLIDQYIMTGIDSFAVTSASDTLAIPGISTSSFFNFIEYTPAHSSAVDSVSYSYSLKTDTVFVTRTPYRVGSVLKSDGIYKYEYIER